MKIGHDVDMMKKKRFVPNFEIWKGIDIAYDSVKR